ncbi:MAG: leucine--tRNA ligase [Chitinophagales bacterium]|nr:leucine--tRNA ligase [Chitinophagales bacterium]
MPFTAEQWRSFSKKQKSDILLRYRLAYLDETWVNWCPALGTVLANDEVKDGRSERGGFPVERRRMKQWMLRMTAYADRLLEGLEALQWPESIKEAQRNWIGRSYGCSVFFELVTQQGQPLVHEGIPLKLEVFTTRPDTIFGATFLAVAPEHELVAQLTDDQYKSAVQDYLAQVASRSERDRIADALHVSGQFLGSFGKHPFTGQLLPVYVADYILATYGTGAIMGVPGHDERDHRFASVFSLPIVSIIEGQNVAEDAYSLKEGVLTNSDFLNGLSVPEAIQAAISEIERRNLGQGRVHYRLRDAVFGRQRYWGEPIPIYYDEEGIPHGVPKEALPVRLPEVDLYLPTSEGEPPLARAQQWKYEGKYEYEKTTMPGWAGSSWYFLRFMDPHNNEAFAAPEALRYWGPVDLYVGGDEHATGHLIYFRFWTHFLYDLGLVPFQEPALRLVNQGKIQGLSCLIYRLDDGRLVSAGQRNSDAYKDLHATLLHIPVALCEGDCVDIEQLRQWRSDFAEAEFIPEADGSFRCVHQVEKMSKSKHNVVNPDDLVRKYGADCFRLYEMFLGPLEQDKPWDTKGIDGCYRFLRRLWRLFMQENGQLHITDEEPVEAEWRILHRLIHKVTRDIEQLSLNTAVSAFMIAVNELTDLGCRKRAVLEPLLICLSPFAPFTCEYLWHALGHRSSVVMASWPQSDQRYLQQLTFDYPVAINGRTRLKLTLPLDLPEERIEQEVLATEGVRRYLEGRKPKKVIIVKGRMINVVV